MRAVIQRVTEASVTVEGRLTGKIGPGLMVLLGVAKSDTEKEMDILVKKLTGLRIFQDEEGKTNLSIQDVDGEMLVVSQFTLLADCRKGRRPSFVHAGDPDKARQTYEAFVRACREKVKKVETGEFGAYMQVSLVNDGPFTIVLDTDTL
ncbi:MAG: D-tyrosyl-tRNA(Tyr) deacylase [Eubacterium sp.]|nr:D-tyrosyl-tRNA(Tyr) deacylase [Eubacterium sp.]